jgi:GGDEF domain-containing protein
MESGRIVGLIPVRQLLLASARAMRASSSRVAPLTGLPSRVQADQWLAAGIREGRSCDVAIVDLRDFGAYNMAHGFEQGDAMLLRLLGLARSFLTEGENGTVFNAHLGEDRFLFAFHEDARSQLRGLIAAFEERQREFFSPIEVATGTFRYIDPVGHEQQCPLTTVRAVYLPRVLRSISEPIELYYIARRLSLRSVHESPSARREVITEQRRAAKQTLQVA